MKTTLTIIRVFLFMVVNGQSHQLQQIGKHESDVLFNMKSDTSVVFDSYNKEDDRSFHLTYNSKTNTSACNFYFTDDVCTEVGYYYPLKSLPQIITNLNIAYKRTDNTTWIDGDFKYKIKVMAGDTFVRVSFMSL